MKLFFAITLALVFSGCNKIQIGSPATDTDGYNLYTIPKGEHYAGGRVITSMTISEMSFIVKFDSSAIYQNLNPDNQYDINKLYGFSEGLDPHMNSARIGWSYNNGALRLYAYAYKKGIRSSSEICSVQVGTELNCSIILHPESYTFKVNNFTASLPRETAPIPATVYKLFPYFGGDETSPHDIRILIKDLPSNN